MTVASTPIPTDDGTLLAVLAGRIQMDTVADIIHQHTGTLTSEEALVVNRANILKIYAQGAASVIPLPDKQGEFDQVFQAMAQYWSSIVRLPIETN